MIKVVMGFIVFLAAFSAQANSDEICTLIKSKTETHKNTFTNPERVGDANPVYAVVSSKVNERCKPGSPIVFLSSDFLAPVSYSMICKPGTFASIGDGVPVVRGVLARFSGVCEYAGLRRVNTSEIPWFSEKGLYVQAVRNQSNAMFTIVD